MGRLIIWVIAAVLAVLLALALWLMFAPTHAGTRHVEKVVPLGTLAR